MSRVPKRNSQKLCRISESPLYAVRRLGSFRSSGVTAPVSASVDAVIKFDTPESPHCVYNEITAVNLAQRLNIPVANGVLTTVGTGLAFASLELGAPGVPLREIAGNRLDRLALIYPDAVAALVAFDVFIGNCDRAQNFRASLVTPHVPLFCAFDHSHALLGIAPCASSAIRRLRAGELVSKSHPFYGLVEQSRLSYWIERICDMSSFHITESCEHGRAITSVSSRTQRALGRALLSRRDKLTQIIEEHEAVIKAR